ncbi:uncharacterized protein I303_106460 [Kwoniella dejecticola CBS 10117]|uniref:Ribosomal RNA-processing protein 42 n=1 Tax=Kwoniella dejecticola CBS 10117 TaxID=1296121 RepID=A0A1A5ZUM9_9TREE|nr:uncharacterized protein I303_08282 [Kwoniella dejecticola CBS 10117]OBR81512.1 hypothetical protein I303_08282 [Kwoniella dejecticola CBS 10117]
MSIPTLTLSPSEISYIQTSLSHPDTPTRLDGRSLLDSRGIEVAYNIFPHANGSARVKIGNTEVIAGIKLEVVDYTPVSSSTSSGTVKPGSESWRGRVDVDITPQSFPSAQPNALSSLSTYLSSIISSQFLPSIPSFPITTTKYFQPQLHLSLLSSDGNILTALIIASRSAFADLKIPKIKVIQWTGESESESNAGGGGVIGKGDLSGIKAAISTRRKGKYVTKGNEDWDLDLSGDGEGLGYMEGREKLPVLITLNLVPNSDNIFIDSTAQEESACPSKLHLFFSASTTPSMSSSGNKPESKLKICGIRFEGGQSIDASRIKGLLEEGSRIAKELIDELNTSLPK